MSRKRSYANHHAYPSSSFPQFKDEPWNLRQVSMTRHMHYHAITGNQSPISGLLMVLYEFSPLDLEHWLNDPGFEALIELVERMKEVQKRKEKKHG